MNKVYHLINAMQNSACKLACKNDNYLIDNSKSAPARGTLKRAN